MNWVETKNASLRMLSIGELVDICGKNVVWHEGADEQFFDSIRACQPLIICPDLRVQDRILDGEEKHNVQKKC